MEGTGDDRTFRVNFSSEGVEKLRDNVKEKLKEYMGDYTDDTLVEYVIVLLKNGRRKDEARNELNVFLDDDSDSFVAWLWEHLGSNLNLYIQPQQSRPDVVLKKNPDTIEHAGGDSLQIVSESAKSKPDKVSKSRHRREWKEPEIDKGEQHILQTAVSDSIHANSESHKVGHEKQSIPPRDAARKKRNRHEDREQVKRGTVSQASIAAPRRLLQSAMRDAVGTSKPNSVSEPSSKRLRSVVSTSAEDMVIHEHPQRGRSVARVADDLDLQEHPQRGRQVARVPNAFGTAIKAVAEAAEDVQRTRSSSNVFDRLGRRNDISETMNQQPEFGDDPGDIGEDVTYNNLKQQGRLLYDSRNNYPHHASDRSALQRDTRMVIDSELVSSDYHMNGMGRAAITSHTALSGGNRGKDAPMAQNSMVSSAEKLKSHDQFGDSTGSLDVDNRKLVEGDGVLTFQPGTGVVKENNIPVLGAANNGNVKFDVDSQKEASKDPLPNPGLYATDGQAEDVDSRTIFVNNVHFAATKDSLSRHFNKSGSVIKVVILTDTVTGQPKGSAYIEFMTKEAAENALSLDGTSFMSRILKVLRKSSAPLEASSITPPWPRVVRASPYAASRFVRPPFLRGSPGLYRSRFPVKPGSRSFQWKRETQFTPSETGTTASINTGPPSSVPRSLTYVRSETKTNGS